MSGSALHIRPIPYADPAEAFAPLAGRARAVLLDAPRGGRYALIAADPFRWLTVDGGGPRIDGAPAAGDPFALLAAELRRHTLPAAEEGAPGPGAIGLFGYELGRFVERLPWHGPDRLATPDMAVGLYDTVAVYDTAERRAWIAASGLPEPPGPARTARAAARAEELAAWLAAPAAIPDTGATAQWAFELTPEQYRARVGRVLDYIVAGDIFQANFTQRAFAPLPAGLAPYALYRRLRRLSPAPFGAYFDFDGGQLLSASPERFLSVDAAGLVRTEPIKGTRPRGAAPEADARLAAELKASAKDRAENLMIVDLLRNDLGRVCAVGSIRVPELWGLRSFETVHHLVSTVEGRLRPGLGPVDLLRAAFPGGSVTGAPKIRAMEIIHELEPGRRGAYCGSIARIGFDGTMDSSIVIRTLTVAEGIVTAQAGGGIVADSDPAAEFEESLVKMRALLRALSEERA
ncbi:MAG TPA: aminodeoxychorismate synthase component I [Alphaproteobacteria bacterium]|nr:aminodeoxychorismate synthase component I [Alphaproteobacteria bacterium]